MLGCIFTTRCHHPDLSVGRQRCSGSGLSLHGTRRPIAVLQHSERSAAKCPCVPALCALKSEACAAAGSHGEFGGGEGALLDMSVAVEKSLCVHSQRIPTPQNQGHGQLVFVLSWKLAGGVHRGTLEWCVLPARLTRRSGAWGSALGLRLARPCQGVSA